MKQIRASALAARAFNLEPVATIDVDASYCAACATPLEGKGVPFEIKKSFGDTFQLADRDGRTLCGDCAALMDSREAAIGTGSGVVSAAGFQRLLSNRERLQFLLTPPEPPFAVAIVNAQRQHVWWMARTTYDQDLIPLQFGHRPLIIDRPLAIEAAEAILDYERNELELTGKTTFVFVPLSRDLKSPADGGLTIRFQQDEGNQAKALRSLINNLSLGDLWAAMQIRAGVRETKTRTPQEALAFYAASDAA